MFLAMTINGMCFAVSCKILSCIIFCIVAICLVCSSSCCCCCCCCCFGIFLNSCSAIVFAFDIHVELVSIAQADGSALSESVECF